MPSSLLLPTGQWPPLVVLFACGWRLGLQAISMPTKATARETSVLTTGPEHCPLVLTGNLLIYEV